MKFLECRAPSFLVLEVGIPVILSSSDKIFPTVFRLLFFWGWRLSLPKRPFESCYPLLSEIEESGFAEGLIRERA